MKIGVLALQGGYAAHAQILSAMNVTPVLVRKAEELNSIDGLIIPGGESTTFLKLLEQAQLTDSLLQAAKRIPFFGTCAGAILMAKQVYSPAQKSLALLDIAIERNAYGRQLSSRVVPGKTTFSDQTIEMVFIRAPLIKEVGSAVKALVYDDEQVVCVQQDKHMVATFHPELTQDQTLHRYFVNLCS